MAESVQLFWRKTRSGHRRSTHPPRHTHLVLAVAAYLKVGTTVAAAFITSIVGDTANTIAEKLCTKIGLCP
jgi:hypothetical protein